MSLLDSASLIVTPNGYKEGKLYSVIPSDGSGDMSVVRATTATRVNSAGLVELVPYNLLQYSEDLTHAIWTPLNEVTITANASIAPNGTTTADRLQGTGSSWFFAQQKALTSGVSHTISAYVKSNTGSSQTFSLFGCGSLVSSDFTATTQWQRFEFTFTSTTDITHGIARNSSNATADLLVWGAQLNEGTIKPYQKTETRLNIPRLDYSNGTCPSLLVEPQRTNLALYSSSFDNGSWLNDNTTESANATTSPSGIQDADTLIENTATSQHSIYKVGVSVSSGAVVTLSFFAKQNTRKFIGVNDPYTGNGAFFDLENGTALGDIGTISSKVIENYGNGWYRCSVTFQASGTLTGGQIFMSTNGTTGSYTGNGTSGIYIWGAQLEVGTYPTSLIPTQAATVTRNADVISKTGISSLIGQTEGTMFAEVDITALQGATARTFIDIGSSGNRVFVGFTSLASNTIRLQIDSGGVIVVDYRAVVSSAGTIKVAAAYKNGNSALYVDGVAGTLVANGAISFTTISNLFLGQTLSSSAILGGGIKATALWKTRLTNDELATLTTI
jgi:hypothetical protein